MTTSTPRNAPCPCGSGKKYKKCCLLKEQTERPLTRETIGRACRKAIDLLLDFAVKGPKPTEAPLGRTIPELPTEEARNSLQNELLAVWIMYLWFPQDDPDQTLPSDKTVAARLLTQEGLAIDGLTRRYIEAARREPFSFWQVESVSSGSGLLLKDLVTGDERSVADLSLSRMASKWDIVFAQVVGLDGLYIVNGLGLYMLEPARFRQGVFAIADGIKKRLGTSPDRIFLLGLQTEFVNLYLEFVDAILHPTLPELRNMDGDKLVQAKSVYRFDASRRTEVFESLKMLRDLSEAEHENGIDQFVWMAKPKAQSHADKVVKARLAVGPDRLETDCNSEARDNALRRRLLKTLGLLLEHESTHLEPIQPGKVAAKHSGHGDEKAEKAGRIDLSTLTESDRRSLEAVLDKQYLSWLDEAVPMLGGKTPRETARTPAGKERVAAMINDWENMSGHMPSLQYRFDFNKLRALLHIAQEENLPRSAQ